MKVTTTTTAKTSTGGGQGCVGGCGGGCALAAAAFVVTKLDHRPGGRTNDVTHPRQQSTHDDSWGGRRQERGAIVGERMTEKGCPAALSAP